MFDRERPPLFFVTIAALDRRRILTDERLAHELIASWRRAGELRRWAVGRYVIMPDHVHFFCQPIADGAGWNPDTDGAGRSPRPTVQRDDGGRASHGPLTGGAGQDLSKFVGSWKSWTTRVANQLGFGPRLWQHEIFDHLLRSGESYEEKWEYVRNNPVRAGLVGRSEDWPWQGELNALVWW